MAGINKQYQFSEGVAVDPPSETLLSGTGGLVGSGEWRSNSNSPVNAFQDGQNIHVFDKNSSQESYRTVKIPQGFVTGSQIKLIGGRFFTSATSGKIKFKVETTLIRENVTVLGTYPNKNNSTNTQVTVSATPNLLTPIGDIDLSDINGQINGVDPQAGDKLLLRFFRDCVNESPQANADALVDMDDFDIEF